MNTLVQPILKKDPSILFDVTRIRADFPILQQKIFDKPLIYLDNAATTQKPQQVINAISRYYAFENANVHRGVHTLSQLATSSYEQVREKVKNFINAKYSHEIIFVRGTTDGINLIADSFSQYAIQEDDEIIISSMEHHSNIVPWQLLCNKKSAKLQIIPMNSCGELDLEAYHKLFNSKTKLVALTHVSNVLGTINPIKEMIAFAHQFDVPVLIDGAQGVTHMPIDVQDLNADFYIFSGHKLYAPTGVGILYGKEQILDKLPPYQGGGNMIKSVRFEHTDFNDLPYKFEAGTPNISSVIGLGAAIDYLNQLGMNNLSAHEQQLLKYATAKLEQISGLRIIGTAAEKAGVISFVLNDIHPHDIGTILDHEGIAIRAGHHCAMPVMEYFQVPATVRVSFGIYNYQDEIDVLTNAIMKVQKMFK